MVKVLVKYQDKDINELVIKGHANYDTFGNDIVCAAISTMAITSVNAIHSLEDTLDYEEKDGLLKIHVLKKSNINQKILNNLLLQLQELKEQYPKNIEIRNED